MAPRRRRRVRVPPVVERTIVRSLLGLPEPLLRRVVGPPPVSDQGSPADLQLCGLSFLSRITKEPPIHALRIARARTNLERLLRMLDYPPTADVVTTDRAVGGAAGMLRARVYTPLPRGDDERAAPPAPWRALVYFHGGGFALGSIVSHDGACRKLASRARVMVVSVEYRLAPEHPFPAAADDAIAATRWIFEHAAGMGIDPSAVAVGGDSAGGNLSAVVSQALRDDRLRPAFQLLIYPATDLERGFASHRRFQHGYLLERESVDFFTESYAPDLKTRTHPKASPLHAGDLRGLPPALVVTAGFDPLRDEGDAYAAKMAASGVRVEHVRLPSMMHGFFSMAGVVREADRVAEQVARSLASALARPGHGANASGRDASAAAPSSP